MFASSSGFPWARQVAPKAVIVAFFQDISRACSKKSASFGLEPGQPPSMKATPRSSKRRAIRSLSAHESEMPSRCVPSRNVVSYIYHSDVQVTGFVSRNLV